MIQRWLLALALAGMVCGGLAGCSGGDKKDTGGTQPNLKPLPAPSVGGGTGSQEKSSSGIKAG